MVDVIESIRARQARRAELIRELDLIDAELAEIKAALDPKPKPKSRHGFTGGKRARPIQEGSSVDWARRALIQYSQPMKLNDLVDFITVLGGPTVRPATLVSNLSRYVKHGDTFSRPAPNTFGLIEWERGER